MKLNLAAINQVFIKSRLIKAIHPYLINEGECYKWAFCAYCLYGGQLFSTEKHAFVKLDCKFYDAEALDGVENWKDLRVHRECQQYNIPLYLNELDEESFISEWDLNVNKLVPLLAAIKKIIREDV